MKALWLEEKILQLRDDIPIPELNPGEALIKTQLAGICSTDLEMLKGYYPFTGVLGHEFVGTVVEAPDKPDLIGKRVVGTISIYCGECLACKAGRTGHCENRRTLGIFNYHGVFAEFFKLPVKNLIVVPDSVEDEKAVFTELLAAALQIPFQLHVKPTEKVVLVGAGRLGLLIAQVLKLTGADLSVVVRRPEPAKMLEKWGIKWVYTDDLPDAYADIVVEATGSAQGFALSQRLVRPTGTMVLKSTFAGDVQVNLSKLVVDEINVLGSRCGPMDAALRLLEQGLIDTKSMISSQFTISQGMEAFEIAKQPGILKVLVSFDD
jgi:threonine dehydrogenase-like Zn-dependent dehydrogenase